LKIAKGNPMTTLIKMIGCSALGLMACSSSGTLPANYAPTQTAIGAADAVGARNEPRAALHLKMARDGVVQAQALAKKGKEDEAALALDRARTDAELALMLTREAAARREAMSAKRELESLQRNN